MEIHDTEAVPVANNNVDGMNNIMEIELLIGGYFNKLLLLVSRRLLRGHFL